MSTSGRNNSLEASNNILGYQNVQRSSGASRFSSFIPPSASSSHTLGSSFSHRSAGVTTPQLQPTRPQNYGPLFDMVTQSTQANVGDRPSFWGQHQQSAQHHPLRSSPSSNSSSSSYFDPNRHHETVSHPLCQSQVLSSPTEIQCSNTRNDIAMRPVPSAPFASSNHGDIQQHHLHAPSVHEASSPFSASSCGIPSTSSSIFNPSTLFSHEVHNSSIGTFWEADDDSVDETGDHPHNPQREASPTTANQQRRQQSPSQYLSCIPYKDLSKGNALGHGSFGKVYKATLYETDVAIKVIKGYDDNVTSSFEVEWNVMQSLYHRNIVSALHYFHEKEKKKIGYVMELMDRSLLSLLDEARSTGERIPLEKALFVAQEIVKALMYLHDNKKVHNDLKPANVLLRGEKEVKLCDFGAVRIRGSTAHSSHSHSQYTPAYTAPERLRHVRYTSPADVYSFGVLLNEMLSGERPFLQLDADLIIYTVKNENQRPALASDIPDSLTSLIVACWAENPEDRPRMSEVRVIVEKMIANLSRDEEGV